MRSGTELSQFWRVFLSTLEQVKTWRSHNVFREGLTQDNNKGKEGIFTGILAIMNSTECHVIAGLPMSWLYIFG